MKINQEKFEELSQIDRIEFLQRVERIKGETNTSVLIYCTILAGFYIILAFVLDIWVIVKTGESALNLAGICIMVLILLGFGLIFDMMIYCLKVKYFNELEEKFFEIKPKVKKK